MLELDVVDLVYYRGHICVHYLFQGWVFGECTQGVLVCIWLLTVAVSYDACPASGLFCLHFFFFVIYYQFCFFDETCQVYLQFVIDSGLVNTRVGNIDIFYLR